MEHEKTDSSVVLVVANVGRRHTRSHAFFKFSLLIIMTDGKTLDSKHFFLGSHEVDFIFGHLRHTGILSLKCESGLTSITYMSISWTLFGSENSNYLPTIELSEKNEDALVIFQFLETLINLLVLDLHIPLSVYFLNPTYRSSRTRS
jgi:hypothetical protein